MREWLRFIYFSLDSSTLPLVVNIGLSALIAMSANCHHIEGSQLGAAYSALISYALFSRGAYNRPSKVSIVTKWSDGSPSIGEPLGEGNAVPWVSE